MKRRRSDGVVVSVLVLILDPIRGVAMDELVEVRPLLQILLELHTTQHKHNKSVTSKTYRFGRGGGGGCCSRKTTVLRQRVVAGATASRRWRRWSIAVAVAIAADLGFCAGE